MPFVILSRAGFDDIISHVEPGGAIFHLNPGVATADEIARLRAGGAVLTVFDAPADADLLDTLEQSLPDDEPLWIENPLAQRAGPAVVAAPAPADQVETPARPWARAAGRAAGFALRRLRASEHAARLMIIPYLGFGNAQRIWVKGRVLDERSYREQAVDDSRWSNLLALYQRLDSDEVHDAAVRLHCQGQQYDTVSDRGGYFCFEVETATPLASGTHQVQLELPGSVPPVRATAELIVPAPSARFGIISDIDDTVLWTNVTNKLNMALMLARSNAHTRKPFKGVAAFYEALTRGASGAENNPIFYVSSSPWHLFGPLMEFFQVQQIPVGPLLLRALDLRELFKLTSHHHHKLDKIELILRFYPHLQFILIGDSGEQDPEIYAEVVKRHPASVRMIYIRSVNPDPARIEALDRLIEQVSATGIALVLAPDSVFAAAHAAAEGLIEVGQLGAVRSEKRHEEQAPAGAGAPPQRD